MVCIRCQKRPAIIFIQRMENGQMKQEGYCLHCARELHIKPVDDLMKQFGMSEQDLDNMENRMESMMEELGDSKPLSMLMLGQNATVTICHSRTKDLADRCREAEIIVAAIGRANHITADMIAEGAVVADVGINVLEDGTLCGDVDYENVREKVSHITPVPGGVGNVTTSVLASHVLRAARIGQNEHGQRRG